MWGDEYIPPDKDGDDYTAFDGIVLAVIGGCILWAALYLVYQMVQS